jgi:hypothetical protein
MIQGTPDPKPSNELDKIYWKFTMKVWQFSIPVIPGRRSISEAERKTEHQSASVQVAA